MAILTPFVTPHGVTATYHKILKMDFDCQTMVATLVVGVYATAEARRNGSSLLWHEQVRLPFSAFVQDPRIFGYNLLETLGDSKFKGGDTDTTINPVVSVELTAIAQEPAVIPENYTIIN